MYNGGVIGMGKMGMSHCSILGAHPDVKEIAICDSSRILLSAFKQHSNFSCYTDYKKMIAEKDLDFVIISTPTKFHFEIVMYAMKNNCHVFCEKPFSLTIKEGKKMMDLSIDKKLVNQVGFHNRYIGTFQATKRFVEMGLIGDIYHINGESYGPVVTSKKTDTWRSDLSEGGGCLLDYVSHVVNLMQFIVGSPYKVGGTILKKIYSRDVEDAVYASFYYKNNLTGQLSVNWSEETYRKMSTKIEILGVKGKIISDAQECQLFLKENPQKEGFSKGWNTSWITDHTRPVFFNLRGEEYSAQLDYFITSITEKNIDNINSFKKATETHKVIEMLRKDSGNQNYG